MRARGECNAYYMRIYSPPRRVQDLGKSSNDLLGRDFPISGVALEVKTATPSNVLFKVGGVRDTKSTLIAGDIEAKFFNKPHGLTFTQTWTTSNILKTQVEIDNQIAKGVSDAMKVVSAVASVKLYLPPRHSLAHSLLLLIRRTSPLRLSVC